MYNNFRSVNTNIKNPNYTYSDDVLNLKSNDQQYKEYFLPDQPEQSTKNEFTEYFLPSNLTTNKSIGSVESIKIGDDNNEQNKTKLQMVEFKAPMKKRQAPQPPSHTYPYKVKRKAPDPPIKQLPINEIKIEPAPTPSGRYYISDDNYKFIYEEFRRELTLFVPIVLAYDNKRSREFLNRFYTNPYAFDIARQSMITLLVKLLNLNKPVIQVTDENFNIKFMETYLELTDLDKVVFDNITWYHIFWRFLHYSSILTYYNYHQSNNTNNDILLQFASVLLTFNVFIPCIQCFKNYMSKPILKYVEQIISDADPITVVYNLHNYVNFRRDVYTTETYYMSMEQFEKAYGIKRIVNPKNI